MKNQNVLALLTMALLLMSAMTYSYASPANPHIQIFKQPDGSQFKAKLKGDEHFIFAETPDGYSIIKNKDTKYWTYAELENGLLVPTNMVVGKTNCPFKMHLRPNAQAVANVLQNKCKMINVPGDARHKWATQSLYGSSGSKAAAGRLYVDVLLGDFTDSTFAYYSNKQRLGQNPYQTEAPFPYSNAGAAGDSLANNYSFRYLVQGDSLGNNTIYPWLCDSSRIGSLSSYFYDMSYRKCWWAGQVDGPRSSGVAKENAEIMSNPTATYYNAVISRADPYVDFKKNGADMDAVLIVHPGPDLQNSYFGYDILSQTMVVSVATAEGTLTKLSICGQSSQLGTIAHEMFHQIGGPDLYDYGIYADIWGEWSLMDMGCWSGEPVWGSQPSFAGGHLAYDIDGNLTNGIDGWLAAGTLGSTDSISSLYRGDGNYTVAPLDSAGEARQGNITKGIRLWRVCNNNFRDSGQVFFVENRRRSPPYESGLPESGILITHIDTRMGTGARFNDGPPCVRAYYSWLEQPGYDVNSLYAVADSLNYYRNLASAAYSADDYDLSLISQTTLDSNTVPNSRINKCYPTTPGRTGPFICDISREGPYMTFNVLRTGMTSPSPLVCYLYHTIKDPAPANNNGMLDPWEIDTINIAFRNDGAAITFGASCSLYVTGSNIWCAQILNPSWKTVNGGVLATGAQGLSGSFIVSIAKETPRFANIIFAVKFRSTVPAKTDTFYFSQRVSPITVTKTYDFNNIYYGGYSWDYRICPSELAIYGDTLFVANENLNIIPQTRIYKVKKSTVNNPLTAADTFGSLNNAVTTNRFNYICGMDIDNSGNLWYTMEDTVWNTNRGNTLIKKFEAPNTDFAGISGKLKRIRGLAFGPSITDTVGTDMINGDSLLCYWQQWDPTGLNIGNTDSLFNYRKVNTGTASIARRWAFSDSGWPYVQNSGYGWNDWIGRALENDGQNLWTTDVYDGIIIQRDQDGRIIEMMPGPSPQYTSGAYGLAHEAANSAGVVYAPSGGAGAPAFIPYAKGTKHYLYCTGLNDSKIYKIDVTNLVLPTSPDSIRVMVMSATKNKIKIYKSDANRQKVAKYIIYRRDDNVAPIDIDSIGCILTSRSGGQVSSVDSFFDYNAKNGKASHYYSVKSVNYSGYGIWSAPPIMVAIELAGYSCSVSGLNVTLNWNTSSENDSKSFEIMRSNDGANYQAVGEVSSAGNTSVGAVYSYTDKVFQPGEYYYAVYEVSLSGQRTPAFKLKATVGEKPPNRYELAQCYPNPLHQGAVNIRFALAKPGRTTLKIYNILGEEVKVLVNEHRLAGKFNSPWFGDDNNNKPVSNGIYLCKLESGAFKTTQKIIVLK